MRFVLFQQEQDCIECGIPAGIYGDYGQIRRKLNVVQRLSSDKVFLSPIIEHYDVKKDCATCGTKKGLYVNHDDVKRNASIGIANTGAQLPAKVKDKIKSDIDAA